MFRVLELIRRWLRHAQRIFHIFIGLVFLLLAAAGGILCFSEWHDYQENPGAGPTHFEFILGFTILLVVLSLYTFAKARSVR